MEEGSIGVASPAASTHSDAAQDEAASASSPSPPSPSPSPAPSEASAPSAAVDASASSSSSSSRNLPAVDDCCICFNGDSEDNDPILFCDGAGCSAVVHQSCYGVVSIPDGDWYCDMCAVKKEPALASHSTLLTSFNRCLLCHHTDGAFKRSETGHWVHVACAIWTPETGFADAERVDTVIGIDSIDRNRWRLICDVCGVRGGTCVQCLGSACRWSAHVLCAWKAGYRLELAAVGTGEELDVVKLVYCDRHRHDAYVKGRGGGRRGVRLNDSALSAAAAAPAGAATDALGRRRRGQDAALEPAHYRCIRCGSRSRQHECSREAEGEADAEATEAAEAEQEVEDEELQLLFEQTMREETEEQRQEREELEAEEEAVWEAEREEMEKEKEERRRQERERRERERSDAAAARADAAIEAGTVTAAVVLSVAGSEPTSLYEEMKRAQERLEDGDALTDEDGAEQPQPRKRRRQAAADETYRQAGAGAGGAAQGGKRRGRPPGSKTRVRRCLQHTEVGSRCPSSCPGRPPPYTEEELKEREEKQRRNGDGEVRTRTRRKRKAEDERMMTTAPGQRKLLKVTRQHTAADQQQTPVSAHVISSPTAASASSFSFSPPSSASSPHSPLSSQPPAHPQPVVAHPIPPPPIAVVPALSSSPSAVLTRPDRPLVYNPKETEDIAQRVQALLACSSPPQQTLLLRQLLLNSPLSYYREVERRIRAEQGMHVLVRWMREARAVSAWGLLSVLMEALHRMCSRQWEVEPALVREIVEEVTRSRAAVSEALRRNAEKLWTKLLDVGIVTESQLQAKDDSSSSSGSSSMLAALNAQLAAITQPSAAEAGAEADGIAAGVKKRKLMVIPSLSSPLSAAAEQKQDRSAPSLHPSPAEVKAAMERQRGREGLRHKKQQGAAPAPKAVGGVAVSAVSKYRQQQAREAEELKRRERAMEREYQAGIEQQQQLSLQHQQHLQHNGGVHHHDAYQYQHSPPAPSYLPYSNPPFQFPSAAQGISDALAAANELMGHLRQAGSSGPSHPSSSSSSSSGLHSHSSPVEAASLALQQLQKLRQLTAQADSGSPSSAGGGPSNGHSAGGGLLTRMVSSVSKSMGWGGGGNSR